MTVRYARCVTFSTDDPVVGIHITYPEPMTQQEIVELEEFLAIWLRGLRRRARREMMNDLSTKLREMANGNYNEGDAPTVLTQAAAAVDRLLVLRPGWPAADHGDGELQNSPQRCNSIPPIAGCTTGNPGEKL